MLHHKSHKSPEELYEERLTRVEDAVQLKVPDQVPFLASFSLFPLKYAGITCEDAYFDPEKWCSATRKTVMNFKPDMYRGHLMSGAALEALGCRQIKLPGRGVPPHHTHQFVEGEYMKADEYDAFLDDPTDYTIRTYIPRVYGALEPLKLLPPLRSLLYSIGATAVFTTQEATSALDAIIKAGHEVARLTAVLGEFEKEMISQGFPSVGSGASSSPFDMISDFLRGMRGSMLDMYRQPDNLLKAQEKILPLLIETTISRAKASGNPRVFMPLHRGADGFMSPKQFETFYWPGLKKLISAFVDEGLTPFVFFEGSYNQRLEYLRELPKGKVVAWFDKTDMERAKDVIGDRVCIMGNMPSSLLSVGTLQEVKDYSKKLIDVAGDGGGFIMSSGTSLANVKSELIKTWVEYTKEYGVYKK